jgi:hypothetical protein
MCPCLSCKEIFAIKFLDADGNMDGTVRIYDGCLRKLCGCSIIACPCGCLFNCCTDSCAYCCDSSECHQKHTPRFIR